MLPDSGGAGKFRGGLGMRRAWRLLAEESSVTDLSEPSLVPNYGVLGGYGGQPSTCRVRRHEATLWPGGVTGTGKAARFPLCREDIVQFDKWGGGGYGDPLERDAQRVLKDVNEGYVSDDNAAAVYGVVIADGCVDSAATTKCRQALIAARVYLPVELLEIDHIYGGSRLWEIGPRLAERLGVTDGRVLECLRAGRAPLRGRTRIGRDFDEDRIPVGPIARKVLGVDPGDKVWLRPVPGVLYAES